MRFSIRRRLILSITLLVLVPLVLVAVISTVLVRKHLKANLQNQAEAQVSYVKAEVLKYLQKPQNLLTTALAYVKDNRTSASSLRRTFKDMIGDDENLFRMYFGSEIPYCNGGVFATTDDMALETDFDQTSKEWYMEIQWAETPIAMTTPHVDEFSGKPVTTIGVKLEDDSREDGVIGIDILLSALNEVVCSKILTPHGVSFLISGDGYYIANRDPEKIIKGSFFDDFNIDNELVYKVKENLKNNGIEFLNMNGKYIVGSEIPGTTGWIYVTMGPAKELYSSVNSMTVTNVIITIISIIIALTLGLFISVRIVKPIRSVDASVNEIAEGKADLTNRLHEGKNDEVGSLIIGFNKFVEKLQNIVNRIKESKVDLEGVEKELQQNIQGASASISEILSSIENIGNEVSGQSQAVAQTSAAVAQIAENINSLERMIGNQSSSVTEASAAVEEMIGNINSVNQSVANMAGSFEKLQANSEVGQERQKAMAVEIMEISKQSETLQDANKAIASVASQTNLLAMNAAIEAAHAGEAGKGFSVVAEEIRKLSETSSDQSKKIGTELKKIANTISSVVEASRLSGENFDQISSMISSTDQLVRQIKGAMAEQQEGSKQIVESLKMMNDTTMEVKVASEEMAEGNRLILDEVHNLQDTTGLIKNAMDQVSSCAKNMENTGTVLSNISEKVRGSVDKIGHQIDKFKS